ncbi:sugar O-acetyltransferase [Symbioplanes lichenis]|uniref:sugar O-acetyltransferase n=1 Tax=Symbioplanes lichenis TaxID=1629072 RepID=UPI0027388A5C|nr:sugar O-acetyltransferase [Actinoplanes lichenis]
MINEAEREVRRRMASRELYRDSAAGLEALDAERVRGKELVHDYNATRPRETAERERLLRELLGGVGERVWIEPPLRVAYGNNLFLGDDVYVNFGLTVVDDVEVRVGDRVMFAPNVTITATGHPVHPALRSDGTQFSAPVVIEDDVWIGAGAILLPGVTVGRGSVVGAGAVVTGNVPPDVVVAGVPARVVRPITDADREWSYKPPRDLT